MEEEIDLNRKFPGMKPVRSAPTMSTINGIGFTLYGRRSFDRETQTYLKAYCFCVLFIPILWLKSYRVADAPGEGWYFLGKEKLGIFHQVWNLLVIGACLGVYLNIQHSLKVNSPEYKAQQKIEEGDKYSKDKQYDLAIKSYGSVATSVKGKEAVAALNKIIEEVKKSGDAPMMVKAYTAYHKLKNSNVPGLAFDLGKESKSAAEKFAKSNPVEAGEFANLAQRNGIEVSFKLQKQIAEGVLKSNPNDLKTVIKVASLYEQARDYDAAFELLMKHFDKLGDSEGARILGSILITKKKYKSGIKLLTKYSGSRLGELKANEGKLDKLYQQLYKREFDKLNRNQGPPHFYSRYKKLKTKEAQNEYVLSYINEKIMRNSSFKRANEKSTRLMGVASVVMEIGFAKLQLAQSIEEEVEKKVALKSAEKTFLSIQSIAGKSANYKLQLGEVYYWLGKEAQGKRLFDQAAASSDSRVLFALITKYRVIGQPDKGKLIAEKIYKTSRDKKEKQSAAFIRGVMELETKEKIKWLERADQANSQVIVDIYSAKGARAIENNDLATAEKYFRKTISGYKKQVVSAAVLNNMGLAYMRLFSITGKIADLREGTKLLSQALEKEPSNSILLDNTSSAVLSKGVCEMYPHLNFRYVPKRSYGLFRDLAKSGAEYDKLVSKYLSGSNFNKGLEMTKKVVLLAPKSSAGYQGLVGLAYLKNDLNLMKTTYAKFKESNIDFSKGFADLKNYYMGKEDNENMEAISKSVKGYERSLKTAVVKNDPFLTAINKASLIEAKLGYFYYKNSSKIQSLFTEGQELYKKSPTNRNFDLMCTLYFYKIAYELESSSSTYRNYCGKFRRSLDTSNRIALLNLQDSKVAKALQKLKIYKEFYEFYKAGIVKFPDEQSPLYWAVFNGYKKSICDSIQNYVSSKSSLGYFYNISADVYPTSVGSVLNSYYYFTMKGDSSKGKKILAASRAKGLLIP